MGAGVVGTGDPVVRFHAGVRRQRACGAVAHVQALFGQDQLAACIDGEYCAGHEGQVMDLGLAGVETVLQQLPVQNVEPKQGVRLRLIRRPFAEAATRFIQNADSRRVAHLSASS